MRTVETEFVRNIARSCNLLEQALPKPAPRPSAVAIVDRGCRTIFPSSPAPWPLHRRRMPADGPASLHLLRRAIIAPDNVVITATMMAICDEFEVYGYRRVGAELRHRGITVNSKKVRRLMREHGLQPKCRKRFVTTPTAITTVRSSQTSPAIGSSTVRTRFGWRTSPTSRSPPASSIWPPFSMPGGEAANNNSAKKKCRRRPAAAAPPSRPVQVGPRQSALESAPASLARVRAANNVNAARTGKPHSYRRFTLFLCPSCCDAMP